MPASLLIILVSVRIPVGYPVADILVVRRIFRRVWVCSLRMAFWAYMLKCVEVAGVALAYEVFHVA